MKGVRGEKRKKYSAGVCEISTEQVTRDIESGMSSGEIVKKYHVHTTTVAAALRRAGYVYNRSVREWEKRDAIARRPLFTPKDIRDDSGFRALAAAGKDVHFMEVEYFTDREHVEAKAKELGVYVRGL